MAKAEKDKPKLVFMDQAVSFSKKRRSKSAQSEPEEPAETQWYQSPQSHAFKTVFLGDSGVGKTCLAKLYVEGKVKEGSTSTIGFDHSIKEVELEDGIHVKLQIWDTAGMEQFRNALITKYYRNANGIILVYDITDKESFQHIENWVAEVRQYCGGLDNVKMALVGNKVDISETRREVSTEEGGRLASQYDMSFWELSAMDVVCLNKLEQLFSCLATQMFQAREERDLTMSASCVIRLGRGTPDEWIVVNAPEEPIPRSVYAPQDQQRGRRRGRGRGRGTPTGVCKC